MASNNPGKPEAVAKALELYKAGASVRSAVEQAGISHMTLLRHLAALGRATVALKELDATVDPDLVAAGKDAVRLQVWHGLAARVQRDTDSADFDKLRSGLIAYGIADDKLEHRGVSGSVSLSNVNQVIVKTEWPEP